MLDRFTEGDNIHLLFNSDNIEPTVKNYWGRNKRPSFVFGSLESALIASAWVVDCGKKSYLGPAEIPSFVFLV